MTGQGLVLHALLFGVEQVVRDLSHVDNTRLCDVGLQCLGLDPRQPSHGELGLGLSGSAVPDEPALERSQAMRTRRSHGFDRKPRHGLSLFDPLADFVIPGERFLRQVNLGEQASVVAVAWVDPPRVDVRDADRLELDSCLARRVGLHRHVLAVVILDAGRRLHLHHAPPRTAAALDRQQHIGESNRAAGVESRFEDRLVRCQ